MEFFDSHAHYDDERFDEDRDSIIMDIYNSGVTGIISAGYSLEGSKAGIELASKYNFIYTTVGISPNDIEDNWIENVTEVDNILKNKLQEEDNKIVAVGEIGLDYHYDTNKECQRDVFIKQIELANKYDLPIVIHTRDAVMDTITILKEHPVKRKGVFHCCPFNRELIKEALKLGFYISVAGTVTFKNAANAQDAVGMIPMDRLLIETDSPYLSPEPVRGTRNDSRNLQYTAKKIAEIKGVSVDEIAKVTYSNVKELYKI